MGSLGTLRGHQAPPQPGLPVGSRAALPLPDPVGAVQEALVVHAGEAVGELEPLAGVAVAEVAGDRAPRRGRSAAVIRGIPRRHRGSVAAGALAVPRTAAGLSVRPRQQVVDAPAQPRGQVRLLPGQAGDHAAHNRPCELGGLLEADVGRDAELAGQLQREPPSHRGMRHHDPLGRERIARIGAHEARQPGREHLEAVGMVKPQSGHFAVTAPAQTPSPAGGPER